MSQHPAEFEPLVRLLRWKRHEQPPPDYFNEFPDRVMARLERWERSRNLPWWQPWRGSWELKPLLVGLYGMAVCGLLLFGIAISQMMPPQGAGGGSARQAWWRTAAALPEATAALPWPSLAASSSMAPVIREPPAAFPGQSGSGNVQPVSFTFLLH